MFLTLGWEGFLFPQAMCVFLQVLLLSQLRPPDTRMNMWPLLWTGGKLTGTVSSALLSCSLNPRTLSKAPSANCCSPTTSEALSG